MRNKKLAAIITGGTMVGSLLLGGSTYAATESTIVPSIHRAQNSEYSRKPRSATNSRRTSGVKSNLAATSTPRFVGTIQAINGSSLTILGSQMWNRHSTASTTTVAYTVNTTDGTVYMKDGKLDSLSDLAAGQRIVVFGSLDSTMSIIKANGINVITRMPITMKKARIGINKAKS